MLLVALSCYDSPGDTNRSPGDGFDYRLVKPVDQEQLERVLSEGIQAA